jgi:hypothetical protein
MDMVRIKAAPGCRVKTEAGELLPPGGVELRKQEYELSTWWARRLGDKEIIVEPIRGKAS